MSTLNTHTVIPKDVSTKNDLDYQFLKQIGIEYIQSMGGNLWTDFNEHDPGLTMLEMLCYAITDLGNRINMPIEDLITQEGNIAPFKGQFYNAREILTSRPVTALDYRKLFIDVDCVRNCWLVKHEHTVYVNCKDNKFSYDPEAFGEIQPQYRQQFNFKGLYDLLIDFDIPLELEPGSPEYLQKIEDVKQEVRDVYHANRNLCEDLINIDAIGTQDVSVCASIEVERDADENAVHAEVLFRIQQYFSPSVRFYSLKEMLDRGYRTDEIYDGPKLTNGFIDTEELRNSSLRTEVRLSDLMNIISSIEGVKVIKDITLGYCGGGEQDEWIVCIDPLKRPVLCDYSTFSYLKDVLPLVLKPSKVDEYYELLQEELEQNRIASGLNKDLTVPQGTFRDPDWYTTIQNDFPVTYGIGRYGLPSTASVTRHSQAKQLKAYLLFFDQILGSYFAQLGVVSELLSVSGNPTRTYYTQAVQDIKGFEDLPVDPLEYPQDMTQLSEILIGDLDNIDGRKSSLLDHLLSRFAERFSEYTFLMQQIYGSAATELIVIAKQDFLKNYVDISSNRGGAFNYYHRTDPELWFDPTDPNGEELIAGNAAGTEKRIARLAGFKKRDYWRRNISESFVEIYTALNGANENVFRWNIRDEDGNILLTSVNDHYTEHATINELHLAVLNIIQTSEEAVEESDLLDNEIIGNIQVQIIAPNVYTFDVIDTDPAAPHYIIARQFPDQLGAETLRARILSMIDFMKFRFSEEGIFIVEHMLLRPNLHMDTTPEMFIPVDLEDCKECCCMDQYSYRVSVVLPGYTYRFANMDFRDFMENLIREEIPSHILPRICWVGERRGSVPDDENDLHRFEKTYKAFLERRTGSEEMPVETEEDVQCLTEFVSALEELNTIYPTGRLLDCEPGTTIDGKIILGRTNLGTL